MKINESLTITNENYEKYKNITEVSGSVCIQAEGAQLNALQTVSGAVDIQAEGAQLPVDLKCGSYKKSAPLPLACPKSGEFEAWEKCENEIIVRLLIPADARRSSAEGKKCRADFADVLEIYGAKTAISKHDGETLYEVGKRMKCHKWDSCRWNECSGGIHFFMTREEAEAH